MNPGKLGAAHIDSASKLLHHGNKQKILPKSIYYIEGTGLT
jgi:hypothetical protein